MSDRGFTIGVDNYVGQLIRVQSSPRRYTDGYLYRAAGHGNYTVNGFYFTENNVRSISSRLGVGPSKIFHVNKRVP